MVLPEYSNEEGRVNAIRSYYQKTLTYASRCRSEILQKDQKRCATRDLLKRAEYKISLGRMLENLKTGGLGIFRVTIIKRGASSWPGVVLVEARIANSLQA
jgi:hypothetical protein